MDQKLADSHQGEFREHKVLLSVFCLYLCSMDFWEQGNQEERAFLCHECGHLW